MVHADDCSIRFDAERPDAGLPEAVHDDGGQRNDSEENTMEEEKKRIEAEHAAELEAYGIATDVIRGESCESELVTVEHLAAVVDVPAHLEQGQFVERYLRWIDEGRARSAAHGDEMAADELVSSDGISLVGYEAADIMALPGTKATYLYSNARMTGNYAQWCFLAAEDDDVATFVACVREESRVYPRPMSACSLGNEPFWWSEARVEDAYATVSSLGECSDIGRVEASNGDVYYYSSEYLTEAYAASLAEWRSVTLPMDP